ncbi:tail fiber assembly protein [Candidatus Pantoea floridensis]|uniref:Virus tail fibre assembly protein, lambda gpK n=1 Tax=Candidatus Pantoea floridensis TaxID=1938870 RepID=A0A286BTY3_9GAMM|nr:tail fiber assembly protein [Pantoea floridensis]PIF13500.1 virus tail fiber assembly protein lambda gpK [Enterobacteriaceae bacterium JKS000233]SOD37600.1 virus tail fibre assembly protein, lambda gpK [Pantoea floridensis]
MAAIKKVTLDNDGLAKSSGLMTIYNFNPESGLFTGSSDEYLPQGVGIPANSTSDAPPANVAGMVSVYSGVGWQQVADHRGEMVYRTATGEKVVVTQPGDYPEGTTSIPPATAFDVWNGEAWITDVQAQQAAAIIAAQAEKSARISEASSLTQAWQTQLLLGLITDGDKASLTKWMQYIQAVQAINIHGATDISWPQKPL